MLRPKLNRIWTSTNAVLRRDPGDTKYLQGWISEIPTYQVLNYLQYKVDVTMLALAERGIFEWGDDVQYKLGSLSWDETTGFIYVSTVGAPSKTQKPSANPTQWVRSSIQVSRAEYDSIVSAINAHIADVTGNPHKLTAGRLNAYNKNEIDAIVTQYRALVQNHASNTNNPHSLTATGVGAVPVTGGSYTGDVTFESGIYFDANKVNKISKTNGLYLQAGSAILGVTDAGVAVAGLSDNPSPIVSEDSFVTLKASKEPEYSTPIPNYWLDFMRNINIRLGDGSLDTDFNPTYDAATGRLLLGGQTAKNFTQNGISGGASTLTLAVDVLSTTARNASDTNPYITFGTDAQSVSLTGASLITGTVKNTAGTVIGTVSYQLTGQLNTLYRVAMVCSSTAITLFLNGAQVATAAVSAGTVSGKNLNLTSAARSAALSRDFQVQNARMWFNAVLTNKQISTL